MGDGTEVERLAARCQSQHLSNVQFLGRQPAEAMTRIYARVDALLVHLERSEMANAGKLYRQWRVRRERRS